MVKNKKIRLKDIAYALNTSVTCVSRSLRDCDDISESTKKAVREKAIELGYQSKYTEIKTKEQFVVALITDSIRNPYFIALTDILFSKIGKEQCDFLVMIADGFNKVDDNLIKKCIYRNADIILSFNEFDEKSVDFAKINGVPLMLLGRIPQSDYVDAIYTDDVKGGELLFNELYKNDVRNFIYLEESRSEASLRRFLGFQKAISNCYDCEYEIIDSNHLDEAIKIIKDKNIKGALTYNDLVALRLIERIKEVDNSLLNKIYITGYDNDIVYLKELYPNFKTIEFDYELIADDIIKIIESKLIKKEKKIRHLCKIDVKIN